MRKAEHLCTNISTVAKYEEDDTDREFPIHSGTNKLAKRGSLGSKFIATRGFRQGPVCAAISLAQLIAKYKPKLVVSVGICAGIKNRTNLRKVVFGVAAENYEEGKVDAQGKMHYDHAVQNASDVLTAAARTAVMHISEHKEYMEGAFITGSAVRLDLDALMTREGIGCGGMWLPRTWRRMPFF
jgi:nucleoside phosphorylase